MKITNPFPGHEIPYKFGHPTTNPGKLTEIQKKTTSHLYLPYKQGQGHKYVITVKLIPIGPYHAPDITAANHNRCIILKCTACIVALSLQ